MLMKKISIFYLSFVFLLLVVFCFAIDTESISPVEAIHLVEKTLKENNFKGRFLATEVREATNKDHPAYIVLGNIGQDKLTATVDAHVARVFEIKKNGDVFFSWQGVRVVGHRGTVKFAPENTIPAFKTAIQYGADLLEMDIRETKDGTLIIMHDATVNRTTNGTGRVSEKTLSEVKQLDAGSWFSPEFKGVQVPTFEEVLEAIEGQALPDIDFKAGTPGKLIKILKDKGILGKVTLYCGDWNLMRETIKLAPDGFLTRPTVPIGDVGLGMVIRELNPDIINIDWSEFSERLVRNAHICGRKSFINMMQHDNQLAMQLAIDCAPDYVQSDHLDILIPLLRARGWHK
jgi:glycerophosphoryl diester phosphodiesterase